VFMLHLNPDRHYIPAPGSMEIDRYLGEAFPSEDLFLYFHLRTGNWTVARWVSKDRGMAIELLCLGKVPWAERHHMKLLRETVYGPSHRAGIKKHMDAAENAVQQQDLKDKDDLAEATSRIHRDARPGLGDASRHIVMPGSLLSGV
jgi:hypothetical protein